MGEPELKQQRKTEKRKLEMEKQLELQGHFSGSASINREQLTDQIPQLKKKEAANTHTPLNTSDHTTAHTTDNTIAQKEQSEPGLEESSLKTSIEIDRKKDVKISPSSSRMSTQPSLDTFEEEQTSGIKSDKSEPSSAATHSINISGNSILDQMMHLIVLLLEQLEKLFVPRQKQDTDVVVQPEEAEQGTYSTTESLFQRLFRKKKRRKRYSRR